MEQQGKTVNIKGPHLYEHQKDLIRLFDDHPSDSIITVKARRQVGKSTVNQILALRQCINYKNQIVIIVQPTWKQCLRMFKEITTLVKGLPVLDNANKGDLSIEFTNGSQICFYSGATKDTVRGPHVTSKGFLLIDEAVYIPDKLIHDILPTVDANHANVVLISTPKFKNGTFYDFYKNGIEGVNGFYSLDWSKYDTSMFLTPEKLEMYRKSLPGPVFAAEYLGEFISSTSDLFGDLSLITNDKYDKEAKIKSMGIDWSNGTKNDYTAITAFNVKKQQCYLEYFNTMRPAEQINHIIKVLQETRPETLVVEKNGAGDVYTDLLKTEIKKNGISVRLVEFVTTNDSKRRIYEKFIVSANKGELTLFGDNMEQIQLVGITAKSTKTGKLTYENDNPATHDDIPDSLAMAWSEMNSNPNYIFGGRTK